MTSRNRSNRRRLVLAVVTGLGVASLPSSASRADDGPTTATAPAPPCPVCQKPVDGQHRHHDGPTQGTLGYGPPGTHPGFPGFGLGYHLGHGYGGDALGVGADGGYPYYGGPGYPHPGPTLKRIGGINPFPHYGGPGYPTPGCPNIYGGVGALVPDRPVVSVEGDGGVPARGGDYGGFTGTLPYPETAFAPVASEGTGDTPPGGESTDPPPASAPDASLIPGAARALGIEAEPVAQDGRKHGLRVTRVAPGSAAERGGLRSGDAILSVNGHVPDRPGSLDRALANAATDGVVGLNVRGERDAAPRTVRLRVR